MVLVRYSDAIMSVMASQITCVSVVNSSVCSGADQRKHQSSAWLAFVKGIHRSSVNSLHKGPVTREMFPFPGVIMTPEAKSCHQANVAVILLSKLQHVVSPVWRQIWHHDISRFSVSGTEAMWLFHKNCFSYEGAYMWKVLVLIIHVMVMPNERYDVSNHHLPNSLFRLTTGKHQSAALLSLCVDNPTVTGEFLSQWVSNSETSSCLKS